MPVIRGADQDAIDIFVVEQLTIIGVGFYPIVGGISLLAIESVDQNTRIFGALAIKITDCDDFCFVVSQDPR